MHFFIKNIISRALLIFFALFSIQILFFLILEDIFIFTIFPEKVYFLDFYIINILVTAFTILIILFILNKKFSDKKIEVNIQIIDLNKIIKIVILITFLGIILSLIAKFFLYGDKLIHHYIIQKDIHISCIFTSIRHFWLDNTTLISESSNKLFLYNLFSPLGTIFLNFYFILIFLYLFFQTKLSKKLKFISVFTIFISVLIYSVIVGSKNILFNTFSFSLCCLILNFIFKNLNFTKIFFTILICIYSILIVFVFQATRTSCSSVDQPDYSTEIEFENKSKDLNINKQTQQKDNIKKTGRYILEKKNYNSKFLALFGKNDYFSNVTLNYTLWYLLTGKKNGEYILYNIERPKIGSVIIAKSLNIISRDFGKQILPVKVEWLKSWGGISFLHLLWYDFYFFGVPIFLILLVSLIFFASKLKSKTSNFGVINFLCIAYIMLIFFYVFVQFFNWYALETINSRFIFFNFLVFIIFIYKRLNKNNAKNIQN